MKLMRRSFLLGVTTSIVVGGTSKAQVDDEYVPFVIDDVFMQTKGLISDSDPNGGCQRRQSNEKKRPCRYYGVAVDNRYRFSFRGKCKRKYG